MNMGDEAGKDARRRFGLGRELALAITLLLFVGLLALGIPRLGTLGATSPKATTTPI